MNLEKKLYISAIICISIQLAGATRIGEDLIKVQSNFDVLGDGFHREMRVTSSFVPSSFGVCKALLKWVMPSGIYVDPYQLQAAILNKTVHFSSHVNIEQMAHHAGPIIFHSFPSLDCSSSCHSSQAIQFHLRYHLPSSTSDYTKVSLTSPVTYISYDCNYPIDMAVTNCLWERLPESEAHSFNVYIPIGDLSHLPFVTLVTIAVSLIGTTCVAWASVVK